VWSLCPREHLHFNFLLARVLTKWSLQCSECPYSSSGDVFLWSAIKSLFMVPSAYLHSLCFAFSIMWLPGFVKQNHLRYIVLSDPLDVWEQR
jgi:hypothetical protein